jgi:hypothetical protein
MVNVVDLALVAVVAILLLLSVILPWVSVDGSTSAGSTTIRTSVSGSDTGTSLVFAIIALISAVAAIVFLVAPLKLAPRVSNTWVASLLVIAAICGGISVLVANSEINDDNSVASKVSFSEKRDIGFYLEIAGTSLALIVGIYKYSTLSKK